VVGLGLGAPAGLNGPGFAGLPDGAYGLTGLVPGFWGKIDSLRQVGEGVNGVAPLVKLEMQVGAG
jgi:hypothetical protein